MNTLSTIGDLLQAAAPGPMLQARLVSLAGFGPLRVTCNWLYSSLNCDPTDDSAFLWQFNKIDDQHISLSPVTSCISQTIYASVRDDIGYTLQVQAPYSADWITAVARDETIALTMHDLGFASFQGFNGSVIAANASQDSHDYHSGYRLRSIAATVDQYSLWFVAAATSLQSSLSFAPPDSSADSVRRQVATAGLGLTSAQVESIVRQVAIV